MLLYIALLFGIGIGNVLEVDEDVRITMKNAASPETSPEGTKIQCAPVDRKMSFLEFREAQIAQERSQRTRQGYNGLIFNCLFRRIRLA